MFRGIPLTTRKVIIVVGDGDQGIIPPSFTNPDPAVQIVVEPQSATFDLGRKTPLELNARITQGTPSANATIRWHLAGYRNGFTTANSGADAVIGSFAVIHNFTSWSPSVEFSTAGVYTVAAEVFDTERIVNRFGCEEITVTYPNIMVRAWVEKDGSMYGRPMGNSV